MNDETGATAVQKLALPLLLETAGSGCGKWVSYMQSGEQEGIFGHTLCGKPKTQIDDPWGTIKAKGTVRFGTDCDIHEWTWRKAAE